TVSGMSPWQKLLNFLFLSVSSRTAGFNTFDLNAMRGPTKLFVCMLMFVGAAPGSTGGGIKVTTMIVLVSTVWCALRGLSEVYILKHQIKKATVYKALAIAALAMVVCLTSAATVLQSFKTAGIPLWGIDGFFEAVSAFGTVGLSVGVSGAATGGAKLALIFTMFFGRVGP
ncbi:MAG: potassium transporter TrkG, partial [Oscillospiraceae bacterium]